MKKKGFTLIELLVVISIIGVLTTFVLSSLTNARKKSRLIVFAEEWRQMKTGLTLYEIDNGSSFFSGSGLLYYWSGTIGNWDVGAAELDSYININEVFDIFIDDYENGDLGALDITIGGSPTNLSVSISMIAHEDMYDTTELEKIGFRYLGDYGGGWFNYHIEYNTND